jgi:hypothetical protein
MTNVVLSKLVAGATICFNPVAYAMHVADGIILRRFTDKGQICLEVKATEGDGAGKTWTIFPEDVIFIRPEVKPVCVLDLRSPEAMDAACHRRPHLPPVK